MQHILNNNDIVAAEAHYHDSCYKTSTKVLADVEGKLDAKVKLIEESQFVGHMRKVIERKEIVLMERLYEIFCDLSPHNYNIDVEGDRHNMKRKVKRMLEKEFADTLHVHQMENLRLLVIPKHISVAELAEEHFNMKGNEDQDERCVMKAAKILKQELIYHKPASSWLPSYQNLQ